MITDRIKYLKKNKKYKYYILFCEDYSWQRKHKDIFYKGNEIFMNSSFSVNIDVLFGCRLLLKTKTMPK
jgi:hypothetical protein